MHDFLYAGREQWRNPVKTATNTWGSLNLESFLHSWGNVSFWTRTLLRRVQLFLMMAHNLHRNTWHLIMNRELFWGETSVLSQYITTVDYYIILLQYITTVQYYSILLQYIITVHYYSTLLHYMTTVHYYTTFLRYITRVHYYRILSKIYYYSTLLLYRPQYITTTWQQYITRVHYHSIVLRILVQYITKIYY